MAVGPIVLSVTDEMPEILRVLVTLLVRVRSQSWLRH